MIFITEEIKIGFLLCLLSAERPIHEILFPTLLDQRHSLENKFLGMTNVLFTYDDFEKTRLLPINKIHSLLTEQDKEFLVNFKNTKPDWSVYDFQRFPGIQWKLFNLIKIKNMNPDKHMSLLKFLDMKLKSIVV